MPCNCEVSELQENIQIYKSDSDGEKETSMCDCAPLHYQNEAIALWSTVIKHDTILNNSGQQ